MRKVIYTTLLFAICAAPSNAQFGQILKRGKQAKDVSEAMQPWTAEQETAIGEASAAKLVHVFGSYNNPDMLHYVSMVGQAVATHASRPMEYKFGILDTAAANALAMPGGYVFVTRGALAKMDNEAELAGVLAHEIAHVDNRHLEKEVRAKKLTGIAASEGFEQMGNRVPFGSYLQKLGDQVVTQALTQSYTRDKEDEADRKGTELAAATGYDANGLKTFLTKLRDEAPKDKDSKRRLNLWAASHPPLDQRVAELTPLAASFPAGVTNEERFNKSMVWPPAPGEVAVHEAPVPKPAASAPATPPSTAKTAKSKAKTVPKK